MTASFLSCSFCGKTQHEVRVLIAGPAVFICDECVGLSAEIVAGHNAAADDGGEYAALAAALPYVERIGEPPPPMRSCEPRGARAAGVVLTRMQEIRDRAPMPATAETVALPRPEKG